MLVGRGTVSDLGKLAITLGVGGITALTPRSVHPLLLAGLARAGALVRRGQLDELACLMGDQFPDTTLEERRQIAFEMRTVRIEHAMCRGYGAFRRGWPAQITTTGADHLRTARAEGRGVVIWVMTFLDLTPINLAAAEQGCPITHLSSRTHGLSDSGPISRRVVAPVILRSEKRSQRQRVIIPPGGGYAYLRKLQSVIEEDHGTVSIRGDSKHGRLMIEAPYLGGTASYPTGAPSLAHRTGAPLQTAATIRKGPLDHEVIIDEPIAVRRDVDRRTFRYEAVQEFGARRERRALAHPGSRAWLLSLPSR
ncbi:MAG: hypothetical protein MUP13_17965 [Thermoanaerobaculales bacterium]|nr:hypothetical protein [Thermoanaerobaculales bacterium]